jgi:hypothetical protein
LRAVRLYVGLESLADRRGAAWLIDRRWAGDGLT